MTAMRYLFFCFVGLVSEPVWAQTAMETAFTEWANRQDMAPAAIVAIDPNGEIMAQLGVDGTTTAPMPIASISKSIAGQCVLHLARHGVLSPEDTLGDILGWEDPQGQITLAELLTHTSGIGPDSTQRDITGLLFRNQDRVEDVVSIIRTRPLATQRGTHRYNNENYFVLGLALDTVLGQDAVVWCADNVPRLAVLPSLGRADSLSALGFAGGLTLSTMDLARLFHDLDQPQPAWPMTTLNAMNSYGPGIYIQPLDNGSTLFHTGGICTIFGPNLGAFAARLANGYTIAMTYSGCADGDDLAFLNGLALELLRR